MTGMNQVREKHLGVPSDNGGRFAGLEHDDDGISLTTGAAGFDDSFEERLEDTEPVWSDDHGRVFHVPDEKTAYAIAAIARANSRLERSGIEERFTYTVEDAVAHVDGRDFALSRIVLNQPRIGFEGWTFTGAHDITPDGKIISHTRPDFAGTVEDAHCDHCGSNRRRERVYTLHSDTDGDIQVGKSCLAAFLGIKPEGLWALEFIPGAGTEDEDYDPDDWASYVRRFSNPVYPADELLGAALNASNGGADFITKNSAGPLEVPTSMKVLSDWDNVSAYIRPEYRKLAAEVRAWVDTIPDDTDNDYLANLKAVLSGEDKWVKKKHAALAVSAIVGYRKATERAAADAAREKVRDSFKPGFLAAEKDKFSDVKATILRASVFEGDYGSRTAITMISDEGHQLTWFATGVKNLEPGQKIKVKGTVKEHSAHDGADQTVITRAKLTDPETDELLG